MKGLVLAIKVKSSGMSAIALRQTSTFPVIKCAILLSRTFVYETKAEKKERVHNIDHHVYNGIRSFDLVELTTW